MTLDDIINEIKNLIAINSWSINDVEIDAIQQEWSVYHGYAATEYEPAEPGGVDFDFRITVNYNGQFIQSWDWDDGNDDLIDKFMAVEYDYDEDGSYTIGYDTADMEEATIEYINENLN